MKFVLFFALAISSYSKIAFAKRDKHPAFSHETFYVTYRESTSESGSTYQSFFSGILSCTEDGNTTNFTKGNPSLVTNGTDYITAQINEANNVCIGWKEHYYYPSDELNNSKVLSIPSIIKCAETSFDLGISANHFCFSHTNCEPGPKKTFLACQKLTDPYRLKNFFEISLVNHIELTPQIGTTNSKISMDTDGINWGIAKTENDVVKIAFHQGKSFDTTSAAGWGVADTENLLGITNKQMGLATDGKRWCVASTNPSNSEIYLACTKGFEYKVSEASSWQRTNLSGVLGTTGRGVRLATDGIKWCLIYLRPAEPMVMGTYLACSKEGSNPLNADNWTVERVSGSARNLTSAEISFYRSCVHPYEVTGLIKFGPKNAPNNCCSGLLSSGESNMCELYDYFPDEVDGYYYQDVKEYLALRDGMTGAANDEKVYDCNFNTGINTSQNPTHLFDKLYLFHQMFGSDEPVGLFARSRLKQKTYLKAIIRYINKVRGFLPYSSTVDSVIDILISVASGQKLAFAEAYKESHISIQKLKAAYNKIKKLKKGWSKTKKFERDEIRREICLISEVKPPYESEEIYIWHMDRCLKKVPDELNSIAFHLQIESLKMMRQVYGTVKKVLFKSYALLEYASMQARSQNWTCTHGTVEQCGETRLLDVDQDKYYVDPILPFRYNDAYNPLPIDNPSEMSIPRKSWGGHAVTKSQMKQFFDFFRTGNFVKISQKNDFLGKFLSSEKKGNYQMQNLGEKMIEYYKKFFLYQLWKGSEEDEVQYPVFNLMKDLEHTTLLTRKYIVPLVTDLELMNYGMALHFDLKHYNLERRIKCIEQMKVQSKEDIHIRDGGFDFEKWNIDVPFDAEDYAVKEADKFIGDWESARIIDAKDNSVESGFGDPEGYDVSKFAGGKLETEEQIMAAIKDRMKKRHIAYNKQSNKEEIGKKILNDLKSLKLNSSKGFVNISSMRKKMKSKTMDRGELKVGKTVKTEVKEESEDEKYKKIVSKSAELFENHMKQGKHIHEEKDLDLFKIISARYMRSSWPTMLPSEFR